jgi:hypothetical protein
MTSVQPNGDSTNLAAELQKSSLLTEKIEPISEEKLKIAEKFKEEGNAEFKSLFRKL